ncbi:MAG TPA: hypothetical protein VMH86_06985 [Rhizomicrobium sp.]|nr:hypothetical protein [Rhizomicrobium sp.]
MTAPDFGFLDNLNGMVPIFIGAILATAGGVAATQMEWHVERKRRTQQAALFFGEVLSTLHYIMEIAHRTHGRGDPFGLITMRMLRSAKRELDIYDRNRETLFDIPDPLVRAKIHTLILRVNSPLEGIFDATDEIRAIQNQLGSDIPQALRQDLDERLIRLGASRDAGYDFTMETVAEIPALLALLAPVAGHSFADARIEAEATTGPGNSAGL